MEHLKEAIIQGIYVYSGVIFWLAIQKQACALKLFPHPSDTVCPSGKGRSSEFACDIYFQFSDNISRVSNLNCVDSVFTEY